VLISPFRFVFRKPSGLLPWDVSPFPLFQSQASALVTPGEYEGPPLAGFSLFVTDPFFPAVLMYRLQQGVPSSTVALLGWTASAVGQDDRREYPQSLPTEGQPLLGLIFRPPGSLRNQLFLPFLVSAAPSLRSQLSRLAITELFASALLPSRLCPGGNACRIRFFFWSSLLSISPSILRGCVFLSHT